MGDREQESVFFTNGATSAQAVGAATASEPITRAAGARNRQVRLVNNAATVAFIKFGDSAVVATTSDMPMLPYSVEVFTTPESHVAVIGTGGTLYITAGVGG
jgi:hypothetical protein